MDTKCISLSFVRKGNRIIGFSLGATGENYAETFCCSFPLALQKKKADIRIEGTKITFEHKGLTFKEAGMMSMEPACFETSVAETDARQFSALLHSEDEYESTKLIIMPMRGFAKGFIVMTEEK